MQIMRVNNFNYKVTKEAGNSDSKKNSQISMKGTEEFKPDKKFYVRSTPIVILGAVFMLFLIRACDKKLKQEKIQHPKSKIVQLINTAKQDARIMTAKKL